MVLFFLLLYPLLPGSWGYHIGFLAFIPSSCYFCGYDILFLTPIPTTARLLGVLYWLSRFHTLAIWLLRVSHSFSYSHTRYYLATEGTIISFSLSYPHHVTFVGMIFFFLLSYPLLSCYLGYYHFFLIFIPTTSDSIYTIRYLPQITLTLNERFCLHNSGNIRR